jgi:hypothetical protein
MSIAHFCNAQTAFPVWVDARRILYYNASSTPIDNVFFFVATVISLACLMYRACLPASFIGLASQARRSTDMSLESDARVKIDAYISGL